MIRREHFATTFLDDIAPGPALSPLTPGEVLLEEFLRPAKLTAGALAAELGIPTGRLSSIIDGSSSMTAEMALLLAHRFGTSGELWMNLQTAHDLAIARQSRNDAA